MSDSLAEYVSGLLRQGYREEQIRESLRRANYPESAVNAVFAALGDHQSATQPIRSSRVEQLTSYIKTYLAQGYQVEQMRPFLQQQGYDQRDIDRAIELATSQQTIRHEVHLPFATVAKIAFLLIIVAGIAVFFLKGSIGGPTGLTPPGTGEGTRLLDVKLTLDPTTSISGERVTAEVDVTNMGTSAKYDVSLKFQLLDKYDTALLTEEVTKAVSTSFTHAETIALPKELPAGNYRVKVVADYYGEAPATASASLAVKAEEEEKESSQQTTSTGTSTGQENNYVVVRSEPKENPLDEALALAKRGESAQAEATCLAIENQARRDGCLSTIILTDRDARHCEKITSSDERDTCYMPFILEGKYEYCAKLESEERKGICEDLQHLHQLSQQASPQGGQAPDINEFATQG